MVIVFFDPLGGNVFTFDKSLLGNSLYNFESDIGEKFIHLQRTK